MANGQWLLIIITFYCERWHHLDTRTLNHWPLWCIEAFLFFVYDVNCTTLFVQKFIAIRFFRMERRFYATFVIVSFNRRFLPWRSETAINARIHTYNIHMFTLLKSCNVRRPAILRTEQWALGMSSSYLWIIYYYYFSNRNQFLASFGFVKAKN